MAETPRHPIQVVSRRTGLTADTIRVWERRYAAVTPHREANNRRLYSDADVERLSLLRQAISGGRRIGDVAGLETDDLLDLVERDRAEAASRATTHGHAVGGADPERIVQECLASVEALDAAGLETALNGASNHLGVHPLIHEVLSPLLRTVGERWASGELRVAHEHLVTATVRGLLSNLRHSRPGASPGIVIATPAGQTHELGALMAAVTASAEGWRVWYLGVDLPADEIAHTVSETDSKALAVSLTYPNGDSRFLTELRRITELVPAGTRLFVGGRALVDHAQTCRELGAIYLPDHRRLADELRLLRAQSA